MVIDEEFKFLRHLGQWYGVSSLLLMIKIFKPKHLRDQWEELETELQGII